MFKTYETELAGRKLTIETGKIAGLANGSVMVRYGDTVVMVNVTAAKEPKDGIDFFPLSVDYEEKLYAVGKIPGSFQKREGKPADKAILTSRAIDRPLRPLFPKDFRNDVVVVATVLSVEQDNSPEVCARYEPAAERRKPKPSERISRTPSPKISSPFIAWRFKIAKMMSCLRLRAIPSRPMNSAILMSSPIGFFLSSVKFINGQIELRMCGTR